MRGRLFETAAAAKIATSAAERRNAMDAGALQHAPPTVDYHRVAGAAPDPGGQARALARPSGGQLARVGGSLLQLDLSQVRLHTDARADQLTHLLQARAFTTGPDIFLRRGEYRPGSTAGQRLLAHELTHVAQQTGGTLNADGVSGLPVPPPERASSSA